eukprot:gnl/MRDRNA2_/MRDRNA2_76899_c0_seq1.p1 gnl/MRDRNA2_/MRDRNA2_76899_c0~~gnl/MRDRNA2_/MRDRNA2_76899_c0_seq1.p1  ORF type:complete len:133 (-),score=22.41 gnl/MRDRNA2_/MRDRNA2_76899_c0_seq1:56-454(-)
MNFEELWNYVVFMEILGRGRSFGQRIDRVFGQTNCDMNGVPGGANTHWADPTSVSAMGVSTRDETRVFSSSLSDGGVGADLEMMVRIEKKSDPGWLKEQLLSSKYEAVMQAFLNMQNVFNTKGYYYIENMRR